MTGPVEPGLDRRRFAIAAAVALTATLAKAQAALTRNTQHPSAKGEASMRCFRLRKNERGESEFDEGDLPLDPREHHTSKSPDLNAVTVSFAETEPTGEPTWHTAPSRQLVLTLGGTLEFQTSEGERFTIEAGDVLLAEDTTGRGHGWRIIGNEPWRRVYVVLAESAEMPFRPKTEAQRR